MTGITFVTFTQYTLYGWLVVALIVTTATDVFQRRILNLVTYPTILMAILTYCFIGGLDGLLFCLGGLIFGFIVFFLPYIMGGMGAGDVKLMSAVGAVLGFKMTVVSSFIIAICGGILALGFMVYRRNLKYTLLKIFLTLLYFVMHKDSTMLKVDNNKLHQDKIPYGVAIASGVFLLMFYLILHDKSLPVFQNS